MEVVMRRSILVMALMCAVPLVAQTPRQTEQDEYTEYQLR